MPRTSPGRTLGEARRATEHAQILVHRADSPTCFRSARDAAEVRWPTPEQARVASSPRAQWRRCQRHTRQSRGQRLHEPSPSSERLASSPHLFASESELSQPGARSRVLHASISSFSPSKPAGPAQSFTARYVFSVDSTLLHYSNSAIRERHNGASDAAVRVR
jgi:hypothetical protein